jgi:hypothetical protein
VPLKEIQGFPVSAFEQWLQYSSLLLLAEILADLDHGILHVHALYFATVAEELNQELKALVV